MVATAQPAAPVFVYASLGAGNLTIGTCTVWLDPAFFLFGSTVADANGDAQVGYAIPNDVSLEGLAVTWQAASLVAGGPLFGFLELSNGVTTLLATR